MVSRRKRARKTPLKTQNGPSPAKKARANRKELKKNVPESNTESNDNDSFVIESVSGVAIDDSNRKPYFLIKWKGYPHDESTWEPLEHINDKSVFKRFQPLIEKIEGFQESAGDKRKKGTRGRKPGRKKGEKDQEYEVEDILGIWFDHEDAVIRYKIKWKDYPLSECTWETSKNLTQCEDHLKSISSAVSYLEEIYLSDIDEPKSKAKSPNKRGRKAGKAKPETEEQEVGAEDDGEVTDEAE